ncbi:btb (poz) domain-containing 2a-related [Anaeramoeba ignava]|uniref:Btb (Poz) domain-containing 2a-related n=1 Tax=Anaeramoeba ignava TaxID=1746090 RepID=A0A9Q0R4B3_ANAIG|nr:btb (poz) domain-containing 2a-related [Anaeramoeba ignava]
MDTVFKPLINNTELADVKFYVGGNRIEIFAHRLILSLSSSIWSEMFYPEEKEKEKEKEKENEKEKEKENEKENESQIHLDNSQKMIEIDLPMFQPEIFLKVIHFVYTHDLGFEDDEDEVFQVLEIANQLKIESLLNFCLFYLSENLNLTNWMKCYELAKLYNSSILLDKTFSFLEINSIKLFQPPHGLIQYSSDFLKDLLSLENISSKEFDLLLQVVEWGRTQSLKDGNDLINHIKDFLGMIRIEIMTKSELEDVLKMNLFDSSKILSLIEEKKDQKTNYLMGRRGAISKIVQDIKVVVLCSDDRSDYVNDAIQSIQQNGIAHVDHINGRIITPSLKDLMKYDVLFIYSDYNWSENQQTSDVVKEYVESGGGIVICGAFALSNEHPQKDFLGDIVNGFIPLSKGKVVRNHVNHLGKFDKKHPIMNEIKTFHGGNASFYVDTEEIYGGEVIARWDNGKPLVIEKKPSVESGLIIVLNIFPISSHPFSNGWNHSTDGGKLISNAVQYCSEKSPHTIQNIELSEN